MANNGWIKLHRKILDWEWYDDANTFRVFIHLLLKANHDPIKWHGIQIKKGQIAVGRKQLAKELKLSEKNIRTALKHLISTNEVATKTTNLFSIITITNYDKYQQSGQQNGQRVASGWPAGGHKQEGKEYKEGKENNILSKNKFSDDVFSLYKFFISTLPERLQPKRESVKNLWLDVLDKCIRINHYNPDQIKLIIEVFRNDSFWRKNFLSPVKLRNKNKDGISYIDYFWARIEDHPSNGRTAEEIELIKLNREIVRKQGIDPDRIPQLRLTK